MQNRENDIVLFMDENIQLEVPVSQDGDQYGYRLTRWLFCLIKTKQTSENM